MAPAGCCVAVPSTPRSTATRLSTDDYPVSEASSQFKPQLLEDWAIDLSAEPLRLSVAAEHPCGGLFEKGLHRSLAVDALWQQAVESDRTPARTCAQYDAVRYLPVDGTTDVLLPQTHARDWAYAPPADAKQPRSALLARRRWTEGNLIVGRRLQPLVGVQGSGSDGRYVFLAPAVPTEMQQQQQQQRPSPADGNAAAHHLVGSERIPTEILSEDPLDLVEMLALALDRQQVEANCGQQAERSVHETGYETSDTRHQRRQASLHASEASPHSSDGTLHDAEAGAAACAPVGDAFRMDNISTAFVADNEQELPVESSELTRAPLSRRALVRTVRSVAEYIHAVLLRWTSDDHADGGGGLSAAPRELDELTTAGIVELLEILLWNEGVIILNDTDGLTAAVYGASALADLALCAPYETLVGSASVLECLRQTIAAQERYRFGRPPSPLSQLLLREAWRCLRNITGNTRVANRLVFLAQDAERNKEPSLIELALLLSDNAAIPAAIAVEAWACIRNWCAAAVEPVDPSQPSSSSTTTTTTTTTTTNVPRRQPMTSNPWACFMLLEKSEHGATLWRLATRHAALLETSTSDDACFQHRQALEQLWALISVMLTTLNEHQWKYLDGIGLLEAVEHVLQMPWQFERDPFSIESAVPADSLLDTNARTVPLLVRQYALRCVRLLTERETGLRTWLQYTRKWSIIRPSESVPLLAIIVKHLTCTQMSERPAYYALAIQAGEVLTTLCRYGSVRGDLLQTPGLVHGLVGQLAAQSLDLLAQSPQQAAAVPAVGAERTPAATHALPRNQSWVQDRVYQPEAFQQQLMLVCLQALTDLAALPQASPAVLSALEHYGGVRFLLDSCQVLGLHPAIRSSVRNLLLALRSLLTESNTTRSPDVFDIESVIQDISRTATFLCGFSSRTRLALELFAVQQRLSKASLSRSVSSSALLLQRRT